MRSPAKEKKENIIKPEDDTLYGLLSMYKLYNTYFRILISEDNEEISLQITNNPKKWPKTGEGKYKGFKLLKRSETGMIKLSLKYLSPEHLINQMGPTLGLKLPDDEIQLPNSYDIDGYYSIQTKYKHLQEILLLISKIIELTPRKKYEILEKNIFQES